MDWLDRVGTWLSLVEHSLGVRGVGSSNLPVPTIKIRYLQKMLRPMKFAAYGLLGTRDRLAVSCCTKAIFGIRHLVNLLFSSRTKQRY